MNLFFRKSSKAREYMLLGDTGQHKDILQLEKKLRLVKFYILERKIADPTESDKKVYFFMRIRDEELYFQTRDVKAEIKRIKEELEKDDAEEGGDHDTP